jgi:hypothetical protein
LGSLVGLFVGAALNRSSSLDSHGFRYYYYMAMACFAIAAAVCALVYNPPPLPGQTQFTHRQKLARLDWIGYLLFSSGLVLVSVGLSYSNNPYPWSSARVSAMFAVGMAISVALSVYEKWYKTDGLFHHGLFSRNRNFAIACVSIFFEGLAFFAVNSFFSFQVSVLYEQDAVVVAARYSLKFILTAVFGCVAGWYCSRTRRVRWISVGAFLVLLVFFVCMATSGKGSDGAVWGYAVIMGVAFGIMLTTLITVAQLSTPPELISIATGLFICVRSLGASVGLVIYNAVFNGAISGLARNVADAVVPRGMAVEDVPPFITALMTRNATAVLGIRGVTPEIAASGADAALDTYVEGFRHVWITAACFVVVAAIGTLYSPDDLQAVSLNGAIAAAFLIEEESEFNMRIDNPIEKQEELYAA